MNRKKITLTTVCITSLVLILSVILIPNSVKAKNATTRVKHITSVQVVEGDSLWSIANQYITEDYRSIDAYIKEIKKTNHLENDTIHAGCYIIVPYYTDIY